MKLDTSECLRILGVTPDASPDKIRQAYLDLVRVWHPDRFQSDERLRQVAGQKLRKINDAFAALKNYRPPAAPPRTEVPIPEPAPEHHAPSAPPAPSKPRAQHPTKLRPAGALFAVFAAALCVLALTSAPRLVNYFRAPTADSQPPAAADAPRAGPPPNLSKRAAGKTPVESSVPADQPLDNGVELVQAAGSRGYGELLLVNRTDLEAVARLVASGGGIARAIYLAPGGRATLQGIGLGVYSVHADLGHGLDAARLRFRDGRFTPRPVGPLYFVEVFSEDGVGGSHFEVVLRR